MSDNNQTTEEGTTKVPQVSKPAKELTAQEQTKFTKIEESIATLTPAGFVYKEKLWSSLYVNVLMSAIWLLFIVVFAPLFIWVNGLDALLKITLAKYIIFFITLIASIFVHEGLHALGWIIATPGIAKNIKFDFIARTFTPCCYTYTPMKFRAFMVGTFMPFLVLGLIPTILGIITGEVFFLAFGLTNIGCAGGDLLYAITLRHTKPDADIVLVDHPTQFGYVCLIKE